METRRALAAESMHPAAQAGQGRAHLRGAVLHLDIVGFSTLSNLFAARGQRGPEELAELLSDVFSAAVEPIVAHGGLVGGFAGDALTAAWEDRPGAVPAADRALDAALAVAAAMTRFAELPEPVSCRLSLGRGAFALTAFPLAEGRVVSALMGPAIAEAVGLNEAAPPGRVAASAGYREVLERPVEAAVLRPGLVTLARQPAPPGPDTEGPGAVEFERTPLAGAWRRLEGARFGGSFRDMTVLSVDLAGGAPPETVPAEALEGRLALVDRTVGRWGGYIDSVSFEEKGVVLQAIFGLPPVSPELSAVHAIEAALSLMHEPAGAPLRMGVASGLMFFGRYGFGRIATVSAFGWESSLAARMMQAAGNGVLCDAASRTRAETKIVFADAGAVSVKGSAAPVETARPVSRAEPGAPAGPMFGRAGEFEALAEVLARPGEAAPPAIVRGPPGIGKTWLCRALAERARERGWRVAWRRLRLVDRDLPFVGLAGALDELARAVAGPEGLAGLVRDITAEAPLLGRIAPVLQDVVDLGLAPSAHSEGLTGEARQRALERMLAHLLGELAGSGPALMILDDLQHLDASSASFLADAARRGVALGLVGTVMTEADGLPAQLGVLAEQGGARVLSLDPLDDRALMRLAAAELDGAEAGPELVALLRRQSAGNPLHAGELLRLLRRGGAVEIRDGVAELAEGRALEGLGALPESLRGIITARLDQLAPEERGLIQKASCFGELVALDDLGIVAGEPAGRLAERLARLSQANLVEPQPAAGEDVFGFSHETIRSVAYERMSFTERRALHRRIAEHIEAIGIGPGTRRHGLADLARHWEGAEAWEKALAAHERIAERALRLNAHREADTHAAAALALAGRHDIALDGARRAALLATQALGRHEMMEMRAAEALFREALASLGSPAPEGAAGTALATLPALLTQLGHRLRPGRGGGMEARRAELLIASQVHERLAEIAYFDGRLVPVLNHTLRALNLAERAGESASVVAGFAALAIGAETAGLARLADYYIRHALKVAEDGGAPNDIAYAGLVSAVLHAGRADWARVDPALERAVGLYEEIGAFGRWQQTLATLVHVRLTRGRLAGDDPLLARLAESIDRRTSPQIRMWLAAAELAVALQEGRPPEEATLARAMALKAGRQLHSAELTLADGLIAAGLLAHGRDGEAMQQVREGLARMEQGRPTAWHLSDGIAWQALVPLILAERDGARAAGRAFERAAAALWRYQARMKVARQKGCLVRGLAAARRGRGPSAGAWFARARDWRTRLDLPDDARIFAGLARRAGVEPGRFLLTDA